MSFTIIVGAQWGDEGKGKLVDALSQEYDYVVRFQGGNNAGHTIVSDGKTYKLHLLPSGVVHPGKRIIIGSGCLVDPGVLLSEIESIKEQGIEPNLGLSGRAHIILPSHILLDSAISGIQGSLKAGSTKRGIAPSAADKYKRMGIRVIDLLDTEVLKEKLDMTLNLHQSLLSDVYKQSDKLDIQNIYDDLISYGKALREYICDTETELYNAQKDGKDILLEGAQGFALDPDYGVYPHTTSINNIAGYAYVGSGVFPGQQPRILGVTKAYLSRVGESPLPSEIHGDEAHELREKGHEYGTTTGRPRRVGWLDLVHLKQAVQAHGLTELAITKFDILNGYDEIPVCTAYEIDGKQHDSVPLALSDFRNAKPVYTKLKGWDNLPEHIESIDDIPEEVTEFIQFIEDFIGCDVSIVSYGPDRKETLFI